MKLGAALAALAALAVGGSALASAAQHKSNTPAKVHVATATTPADPAGPADVADPAESTSGPDTDTLQQGDQSAPDTAAESASETAGESASETGPSDGPGGYADTTDNADTQQQGEH